MPSQRNLIISGFPPFYLIKQEIPSRFDRSVLFLPPTVRLLFAREKWKGKIGKCTEILIKEEENQSMLRNEMYGIFQIASSYPSSSYSIIIKFARSENFHMVSNLIHVYVSMRKTLWLFLLSFRRYDLYWIDLFSFFILVLNNFHYFQYRIFLKQGGFF